MKIYISVATEKNKSFENISYSIENYLLEGELKKPHHF